MPVRSWEPGEWILAAAVGTGLLILLMFAVATAINIAGGCL